MRIDIITLFPEICRAPLNESMMKRAQENGALELRIHNLRHWTNDKHHVVDDAPFGGGQGMVMKPEPIFAAVEDLRSETRKTSNTQHRTSNAEESRIENRESKVILMSPTGRRLDQSLATELSQELHLIIVCGHYEGVDHRVVENLIDEEISIGDEQSAHDDSFREGLLEAPQYTRPAELRDWKVPEILLSGNHGEIAKWRKEQARKRTRENRPDLLRE